MNQRVACILTLILTPFAMKFFDKIEEWCFKCYEKISSWRYEFNHPPVQYKETPFPWLSWLLEKKRKWTLTQADIERCVAYEKSIRIETKTNTFRDKILTVLGYVYAIIYLWWMFGWIYCLWFLIVHIFK